MEEGLKENNSESVNLGGENEVGKKEKKGNALEK